MSNPVYTNLPNRALITVRGEDARDFLQGLITNDIKLLESQGMIYACLLTPQGKFLYDFFIYQDGDAYTLDCEGGERADALLSRLKKYKLRAKVQLDIQQDADVFQIFGDHWNGQYTDPRGEVCGYRSYIRPTDATEVTFDQWDHYRISHNIIDGSRDLIPEGSFIHEAQLDQWNAVSYKKGCYVGQELVSRMHHRGLTKKILKCVSLDTIADDTEIRSRCRDIGLALVRL